MHVLMVASTMLVALGLALLAIRSWQEMSPLVMAVWSGGASIQLGRQAQPLKAECRPVRTRRQDQPIVVAA